MVAKGIAVFECGEELDGKTVLFDFLTAQLPSTHNGECILKTVKNCTFLETKTDIIKPLPVHGERLERGSILVKFSAVLSIKPLLLALHYVFPTIIPLPVSATYTKLEVRISPSIYVIPGNCNTFGSLI